MQSSPANQHTDSVLIGKWRMPGKSQSKPSPVSRKPLSSQSLRGRSHYRATDIGHLTHPIVMMALDPPSVASRPADLNPASHTINRPATSRPTLIRPQATLSPKSSLANIGKKRRASQELAATSDCETNPTKRPNRSERDGNAHFTQVESRHAKVELGESMCHTSSSTRHSANQLNRQHSATGMSYTEPPYASNACRGMSKER